VSFLLFSESSVSSLCKSACMKFGGKVFCKRPRDRSNKLEANVHKK
jgi:hypothetical protein